MKQIAVAVGILGIIFTSTLGHSLYISSFTKELTLLLEKAEINAEAQNWEIADELTQTAQNMWNDKDGYLHILLRHDDTDCIYAGFREVTEFIQCQENGEYSAANARLIAELELLSEAEQLTIKNVL